MLILFTKAGRFKGIEDDLVGSRTKRKGELSAKEINAKK